MNILVPDSWLREFLITKASPADFQKYLSLCGPSVEKINKAGKENIYDIEITGNRPDSMSILGIAREAAAILPRFGFSAKIINDPQLGKFRKSFSGPKKLNIKTNDKLNPRWVSVVLENVTVGPSPKWLKDRLEETGTRSLNNVVDVTNYLMKAYGQPAHAFDYDEIKSKNGIPSMILRASKKGEKLTTLDGQTHTLPGDDIVIEDGSGRLIDLCGIMGGKNSAIKDSTKNVVLFLQTYDPYHIRRTSMKLAQRTEAAARFEKGVDSEMIMSIFLTGIELISKLAGAKPASKIYDIYPHPFKEYKVSVSRENLDSNIGEKLTDAEIKNILTSLGFKTSVSQKKIVVTVPSFRRDVSINVDIIEEVARLYGYHNLKTKLPEGEPIISLPDKTLNWEEELKIRLRDWGFTELYTYSMISEKLMDLFGLDKNKAYKITNPLSEEWLYMRPHLAPSVLAAVKQNLTVRENLKVFELSMIYEYRPGDLPLEKPTFVVMWTGKKFREAKGLAEAIFKLFGLKFPENNEKSAKAFSIYNNVYLNLGEYGSLGEINERILSEMGIDKPVTRLYLDFSVLTARANPTKKYVPIPKYPAGYEDLAFIVMPETEVGSMISAFKKIDPLIADVTLLDSYQNVRTFHVTYQSKSKNLTNEDVQPIREKLVKMATDTFGATLKTV